MARALMIQGTSSWAGKSLLTTALARILSDGGLDVAPFKGVNMSNNARVVDGGEIGVAQYLQARAARVEPTVAMNPVLVKPESDTASQVVIRGVADAQVSAAPWRERAPLLREAVDESLDSLLAEHAVVIAEGAGSPAEINLADVDLANMHVARRADASVLLVCDINRGGAFAHLYGTWSLLREDDRARIQGFVLNRFRGDAALLAPAPQQLEELTGVPTLGVVPWFAHTLPDEDGVTVASGTAPPDAPLVAVVRYPAASNLDEFKAIDEIARVEYTRDPARVAAADLLVLPGSKQVVSDLAWLREGGFADAVAARVAAGGRTLAICGGMQMLGKRIDDPDGVEGGSADGLGLLDLTTAMNAGKRTARADHTFTGLPEAWRELEGVQVSGYEIRHGESGGAEASGALLGSYLHGLFENGDFCRAVLGAAPPRSLDQRIDDLAGAVLPHIDIAAIRNLVS